MHELDSVCQPSAGPRHMQGQTGFYIASALLVDVSLFNVSKSPDAVIGCRYNW